VAILSGVHNNNKSDTLLVLIGKSMRKNPYSLFFSILLLGMGIFTVNKVQASQLASIVAYASQSDILAIGYYDVLELRQLSDNELLANILSPYEDPEGRNSDFRITEMVFNSSGTQLAVAYSGFDVQDYIFILDAFTGEIIHSISEGSEVYALAWSPDGSQLAAKIKYGSLGLTLGRLLVWDANTASQLVFEDIGAGIITYSGLDWSSDGTRLLSAYSSSANIWDTSTWTPTSQYFRTDSYAFNVYWSFDDSKIIALDYEKTLYVWDSTTGEMIHKIQNGLAEDIYEIAVSEDNKVAITGWQDIIIWDISAEPSSLTIPVNDEVTDVVWLNNDELIYTTWGGYYIYDTISETTVYPPQNESVATPTPTSSP
jgi:WD40 repeat protein